MTHLTRREFAGLAATAVAAPFAFAPASVGAAAITAQELFDRIKAQIGVAWKPDTVDGLKAGDPTTTIAGIVTTALPTLAVLRQAAKAGANVVIASQPAFYAKSDLRTPPVPRPPGPPGPAPAASSPPASVTPAASPPAASPPDRVFTAKNAFIDEHKLVVIRLSDHWRAREADPMAVGFAQAMGWTKQQVAGNPRRYDLPALSVEALVAALEKTLAVNGGIRVVGDPKTSVRRLGLLPGSTPIQAALEMLPAVDAIVGGEVREWESVEYVRDQVASGAKKALILVGRIVSEEPGMMACADWLKTIAPGVPVRHIAAGDPYWRPAR
jgi:putative NIF3 family GTP cyclohydrolase 1 type 2